MSSSSLSRSLDLEAARRGDVLEVDAAEARRQPDDGLDDLLDVGGGQADRDGVDAAELLEQHGLALHHRHRRGRADVAEAEHGGAVGDDGDGVGHPGVVPGHARVGGDRLADPGDAGRVGEREVVAARRARRSSGSPSCRRRAGRRPGRRRTGASGRLLRGGSSFGSGCSGTTAVLSAAAGLTEPARARPHPGDARRRRRPSSGTGPRCRESTPSAGLSLTQPPAGRPSRRTRSAARFTATVPSAKRATHQSPGRGAGAVPDQQPVPGAQRGLHRPPRTTRPSAESRPRAGRTPRGDRHAE